MTKNTQRRGLYLPDELDNWFVAESELTYKRINNLMLDALKEYKDKHSKSGSSLSQDVKSIVDDYLKDIGIK